MPKTARIACIVAFLQSALTAVSSLLGPIVALPSALIPLMAAIGILRRQAWSAWGLALFQGAQVLLVAVILLRNPSPAAKRTELIGSGILGAILVLLFVSAGKKLAATGSRRGRPWPWIAISVLVTAPHFFVEAFVIPTGAMENTLLIGDRILVQRFPRRIPQRGDVIVHIYPMDRSQVFVKRVVGVAGDRIRISKKTLYRNGVPLNEPYAFHKYDYEDPYRDNFPAEPNTHIADPARDMVDHHVVNGEVVVPPGKYFVLGDNRDNSLDSRYWGFIDDADLIGKPLLIYDSEEGPPGYDFKPPVWSYHRRWSRILKLL